MMRKNKVDTSLNKEVITRLFKQELILQNRLRNVQKIINEKLKSLPHSTGTNKGNYTLK